METADLARRRPGTAGTAPAPSPGIASGPPETGHHEARPPAPGVLSHFGATSFLATPVTPVHVLSTGASLGSLCLDVSHVASSWGSAIKPGIARIRVCAADEDSLTLAWQASNDALDAAGWDRSPRTGQAPPAISRDPVGLWWGTSRPPFAEGPNHAYLVSALGLPPTTAGAVLTGSVHAGMDALFAAMDAIAAGTVATAVVVASDAVLPGTGTAAERSTGAGAAAFVLVAGDGVRRVEPAISRAASDGPATPRAEPPNASPTVRITWRASGSAPVLDRYRGESQAELGDLYDPRLFREQILLPSVESLGRSLQAAYESSGGTAIDRWVLPDPDGRLGGAAAKRLRATGASPRGLFALVGDTGAAAPLLGLAGSLAGMDGDHAVPYGIPRHAAQGPGGMVPGTTAVICYGGGRTSGVLVEIVPARTPEPSGGDLPSSGAEQAPRREDPETSARAPLPPPLPRPSAELPGSAQVRALLASQSQSQDQDQDPHQAEPVVMATYAEVLRARAQLVAMADPVPMGLPPASAGFVRGVAEVLRLEGARCRSCGWTSIPPTVHPACVNCGTAGFDVVPLDRSGTVHTFVVNQTMPPPFTAPLPLAVVDLDDGTRVMLQGISACAPSLHIGQRVHLVLRRYALERGAPVYGYKVSPGGGAGSKTSNQEVGT